MQNFTNGSRTGHGGKFQGWKILETKKKCVCVCVCYISLRMRSLFPSIVWEFCTAWWRACRPPIVSLGTSTKEVDGGLPDSTKCFNFFIHYSRYLPVCSRHLSTLKKYKPCIQRNAGFEKDRNFLNDLIEKLSNLDDLIPSGLWQFLQIKEARHLLDVHLHDSMVLPPTASSNKFSVICCLHQPCCTSSS